VAAASVVGVTSSVRLSCGDSWTLSLLVAPVEPAYCTAIPPAPPPSTPARTTPVINTGQPNRRVLCCRGSDGCWSDQYGEAEVGGGGGGACPIVSVGCSSRLPRS